VTAVLTGLGLAAAAGLNAWAVLLLFHGLALLLPQDFPGFTTPFLASPLVFQVALVLFLTEFVVNKIPLVDRVWESVHTLLRPIIGVLLASACVADPSWAVRAGVALAAAAAALAAHLAKSTTRLTSTAATRGGTQFLLSLAEDVIAVVLAALCFFQPWFTAIFLGGLAIVLLMHRPRVAHALQIVLFRLQHPRRRIES
jgi:Domain of unknown function (DUF4126)